MRIHIVTITQVTDGIFSPRTFCDNVIHTPRAARYVDLWYPQTAATAAMLRRRRVYNIYTSYIK